MSNERDLMGGVVSVSSSPKHGFPTQPQEEVEVGLLGIPGDAHSGLERASFTVKGTTKPNDRPISIVADEIFKDLERDLDLHIEYGGFNEQMVIKGLGDLGWISIGTIVSFAESEVQLQVVDYAYPCINLATYHNEPRLLAYLVDATRKNENGKSYSKRGILTQVLWPGVLKPGDDVFLR